MAVAPVVLIPSPLVLVNTGYTGYTMEMPSQQPFLHFVVDVDLLKRVDDFRFRHRFQSRAAAIKWLIDWALKQKPTPELKK